MSEHSYLIIIAIILLSTKFFGLVSQRVHMPQVVGALLAGLILGPSVLGLIEQNEFVTNCSTIGVLLLMFMAGLDTDLSDLKETGAASLAIAGLGVLIPVIGGFGAYYFFFASTPTFDMMEAIFMGIVLTATSVSITVETLREMGRLKGKVGTIVLGAAIIDDIIGIIVLTVITSFRDEDVKITSVILSTIGFFLLLILLFIIFKQFAKRIDSYDNLRRTAIYGFAFCLALSFVAEEVFGVADITGAYAAGLILCNSGIKHYIAKKITVISYMIFSPLFFASVGINTSLAGITPMLLIFAIVLTVVAVLSKIIGGYAGARIFKLSKNESFVIGCGMIARSEVALIMAQKGAEVGLLSAALFPPVIIMVIVTTLITPILLHISASKLPKTDIICQREPH